MLLPGTVFLPAATAPHALLPPGLYILAIAFALEVSVGKTNTVMALNGSDILLPCTFTTCIGFQDLIFTWYFNSTELVGALQALPVFSWQLLSDVLLTGCFPPPVGCTPSEQVHHRGNGMVQRGSTCACLCFGTKLAWSFCHVELIAFHTLVTNWLYFRQNMVNFLLLCLL